MRSSILLLSVLFFLSSCSASKSGTESTSGDQFLQEGMPLYMETVLPFDTDVKSSLGKVYRGNSFTQSGVFVSENGLFLTNYPVVLDYFSNFSLGDNNWLESGFSANSDSMELPLPGVMLMVLLEQEDVSSIIADALPESGNNYEVYQAKQTIANQLIEQKKGTREDLFVQISELYSGNRQVREVYQILNDVRLVFAPPIGISLSNIGNSQELLHTSTNKIALVRAYWSTEDHSVGFSNDNVPYSPDTFLPLSKKIKGKGKVVATGFPDRTFRHETSRAFQFYHQNTNPYIIDAYEAFIKKEDFLSSQDELYAIRSIGNRYHTAKELDHYYNVQHVFETDSLILRKQLQENELKEAILADTTLPPNYQDLFHYVNQAYDIAEQQGSGFYVTSYAMALSSLDEMVAAFNAYLETDQTKMSQEQLTSNLQSVINAQQSILAKIQPSAEVQLLKDFILILASFPDEEQLFSILSIFEGVTEEDFLNRANDFIEKNGESSVIFSPQATANALVDRSIHEDSLFVVLDEILFINKMARNNQSIFKGYLQPVQQVYNRALLDVDATQTLTPDANGTLRINIGGFNSPSQWNAQFLSTNNDFSGKSPGSILVSEKGQLIGLISDERSERVSGNYLYQHKNTNVKAIRVDYIRSQIQELASGSEFLKELGF